MKKIFIIICLYFGICFHSQAQEDITYSLTAIDEISVSNFKKAMIIPSSENSVVVIYDEILKNRFSMNQESGRFSVSMSPIRIDLKNPKHRKMLKANSEVRIYSNLESVEKLILELVPNAELDISSLSNLKLQLKACESVKGNVEGVTLKLMMDGSNLQLNGKIKNVILNSKASNLEFKKLHVADFAIENAISSNIKISVMDVLSIVSFKTTNVYYKGSPSLELAKGIDMSTCTLSSF